MILLRMAHDALENVGVVFDDEIKAPVASDAGLPAVLAFIVLLRAERWVMQVLEQKKVTACRRHAGFASAPYCNPARSAPCGGFSSDRALSFFAA